MFDRNYFQSDDSYGRISSLPETRNNLGVAYHVQGEIGLAIEEYREALRINPDYADAYSNLGAAYYAQGEVDLAIKSWEDALRIDPSLAQTHHNLGVAYKAQGMLALAVNELEKALRIDPNDADTHFSLGESYQIQGKAEKAVECYQRFIELAAPEDGEYVKAAEEKIQQFRRVVWGESSDPRTEWSRQVGSTVLVA
jgi:tetratricopeptide (TPR) repeat protein